MKTFLGFVLLLAFATGVVAQYQVSYFDDPMSHCVKQAAIPYLNKSSLSGDTLPQLEGWPHGFVCNPTFRNFRGLTLEYLDDMPGHEIIAAINDSLYVLHGDGARVWSKKINGTAIYPPSTADIDNDGSMDIVLVTGGSPYNGHIYAFDALGNIKTGWPKTVPSCWYLCAPVLCDLDDDDNLEIIACEMNTSQPTASRKRIHIYRNDGSAFSENWPKNLHATPAVTPAVADINKDGSEDILVCTVDSMYVFDLQGNNIEPFPWAVPGMKFSYQSPMIIDFRSSPFDNPIEIIGANHGDNPGFYKIWFNYNPPLFMHWETDNGAWTYSTPLAYGIENIMQYELVSQPLGDIENADTCIYNMAWAYGSDMDLGIEVIRYGGLEGFMSMTTSTGNLLYTGSNMSDEYGNGFLHIYDMGNEPFAELEGFPVKVKGSTFINGINLGDVNGDGNVDMVILGYSDSTYINVIETESISNFQYPPSNFPHLMVPCYRGSNTRQGRTEPVTYEGVTNNMAAGLAVYPNPASTHVSIDIPGLTGKSEIELFDISGRNVMKLSTTLPANLNVSDLPRGFYTVRCANSSRGMLVTRKLVLN